MKTVAQVTAQMENVRDIIREAKKDYVDARKAGKVSGNENGHRTVFFHSWNLSFTYSWNPVFIAAGFRPARPVPNAQPHLRCLVPLSCVTFTNYIPISISLYI